MSRTTKAVYIMLWSFRLLSVAHVGHASTGIPSLDGIQDQLQSIFMWAAAMLFIAAGSLFIWHHNASNMHSPLLSGVIDWVMRGAIFTGGITLMGGIGLALGETIE